MPTWAVIENVITIIAMVVIVLGLYSMGAEYWSFAGFLLIVNLNYPSKVR